MSEIRVRRSGLVTFAIRLGSTITGLAFVVIVTSNLSESDYGLWVLISRTIGYILFLPNILNYWTTRYRARNIVLGKTIVVGALIFSAFLLPAYLLVSFYVSGLVTSSSTFAYNLHYFLLSAPQVPLYIVITVLESILWGYRPARASFGFGVFEITKVIFGFVSVGILHLSLTGAVLTLIGAQIVQLGATFGFTRKEFNDRVSLPLIGTMVKTGWLALLSNLQPFIINFDILLVGAISGSTDPPAIYGVAYTVAIIITYSGWIAFSLYASLLAGKDPLHATRQVLELQYLFLFPMTAGAILLSPYLVRLFNPIYAPAYPILIVLAFSSALSSISLTFDNVISGTDTTDADRGANFSAYLQSKIFLVSKINIGLAVGYVISIAATAFIVINKGGDIVFGYSRDVFLGMCWGTASLVMYLLAIGLKYPHVRKVSQLALPLRTWLSLSISTIGLCFTLILLLQFIHPAGGKISQALALLGLAIISMAVYFALMFALSDSFRRLAKSTITSFMEYTHQ